MEEVLCRDEKDWGTNTFGRFVVTDVSLARGRLARVRERERVRVRRGPLVAASFTFIAKRYTFTYTKNEAWPEKEPCTGT